jgi:hypothetical protein
MNEQYLMATHTQFKTYQGEGAAQSEQMPDWLSARYIDLHERVLEFRFHIVTESDIGEPDRIAYQYYGDSRWWWLVCSYNGIVHPLTDLIVGQKLKIPTLQQAQLNLQSPPDTRKEDQRGRVVII